MMIYIFVDIECWKHIIGMVRLDITGDGIGTIYGDQVGATMDGIDMNNHEVMCMVGQVTGTDHPHSSVLIWGITNLIKPLNDSALI